MREKEDPLLTAGNLEPQMQKRGMQLWIHTGRVTLLFFLSFKVCSDSTLMISFPFSLSFSSSFLHSFHLSHQYKGGTRPVPSRNPSLHLCVCVCVCSHSPVFLNLIPRIFITFVLPDILPLLCILGWLASPFSGHWESPLLPFPAGALFTLNYTRTCTPSQTCIVFVFIFVCVNGFYIRLHGLIRECLTCADTSCSVSQVAFFSPYYCFSASGFSACLQGFKFKL